MINREREIRRRGKNQRKEIERICLGRERERERSNNISGENQWRTGPPGNLPVDPKMMVPQKVKVMVRKK